MQERYMGETLAAERVFDGSFHPISFFADSSGRLGSMEVLVRRDGKSYVLSVESYPVHVERLALDGEVDDESRNATYVISSEEIMPADLLSVKNSSTSNLRPYLVEQISE